MMTPRRKYARWIFALVASVPLYIFLTHESCACGPHYPQWRRFTLLYVEPMIEDAAKILGYEFTFPRRIPG